MLESLPLPHVDYAALLALAWPTSLDHTRLSEVMQIWLTQVCRVEPYLNLI